MKSRFVARFSSYLYLVVYLHNTGRHQLHVVAGELNPYRVPQIRVMRLGIDKYSALESEVRKF